ncbi:hypothetical protein F5Y13DRAFT_161081, partial [Hypoxylon sp. FL1857]
MESIMGMIGLEDVKLRLVEIAFRVAVVADKQGVNPTARELSMIFTGNPGTGKTTVAKHYIRFLREFGVLSDPSYERYHPSDPYYYPSYSPAPPREPWEDKTGSRSQRKQFTFKDNIGS